MYRILALLLALPTAAQAAPFCEPLENLHEKIFFCDENPGYSEAAIVCRNNFQTLVQAKNAELTKILNAQIARAKGDAQNLQFKTTQGSYEDTDAMLVALIQQAHGSRAEVVVYGEDFVAPFAWPYLDLGPFPGLHDPELQELFRSADCYKDNYEVIEKVEADFDLMIQQLEATRTKTAQLHGVSNKRELKLDDLNTLATSGRNSGKMVPAGNSKQGASDVTGVKEDAAKRGRMEAAAHGGNPLRKPSALTGHSGLDLAGAGQLRGSGAKVALPGTVEDVFGTQLGKQIRAEAKAMQAPGPAPNSVGEALWNESEQMTKTGLKLGVAVADPVVNAALPGSSSIDGGAVVSSAESNIAAGAGLEPASKGATEALVQADSTLFEAVSRRYRSTSLFRASH